ncbi:Cysteine protease XCP1 (Xylem cysteine peptidase 1) (AtXCP1), partial [Durusdinium trenchii]
RFRLKLTDPSTGGVGEHLQMWSLAVLASLQVAAAQDSTLPKPVDDASQSQKVEGTADEYLQAFEDFVQKFHKHYDFAEEKDRRLKIFSKNMAWVRQRNSEDHNYTVGITPFADLSPGEFRDIYGMQTKNLSAIWGGLPQVQEPQGLLRGILSGAPDSVDWRSKGAVSVVWCPRN